MSRIVSVWLQDWPIARLLQAQGQIPARHRAPDPDCATPAEAAGRRLDPDRPLVLVAPGKGGPRIVSLNGAARHSGLIAGDLLSNARSKVLDLQARPADPAADAAALDRLALWAMRYAPLAAPWDEASGADGLFIDITGSAHLLGGEGPLLADLDRRLRAFGLAPRIAIAGTPGAAWALARFGKADRYTVGAVLPADAEADALRPLPLAALRLPEPTLSLLRRLGLRRIGDVIDAPRAPLAARFEALLKRLDQALGRAPEPLVPAEPAPVYRAQAAFAEPIASHEHVLEAAMRLLDGLTADLARDAMGARTLRFLLFQLNGRVRAIELGLAAPSRAPRHIARLLALRLGSIVDGMDEDLGYEAAALHVVVAEPLAERQTGLAIDATAASPEGLAQLIDRLQQRLGPAAVRQLRPHRSHIPELAVRAGSPSPRAGAFSANATLQAAGRARPEAATGHGPPELVGPVGLHAAAPAPPAPPTSGEREAASPTSPWIADTPRPLLLLPRPEPAEVLALMPEGPPRQFRWRRALHRVTHAEGPERIAPEWWREPADTAERDYYMVEDSAGRRFWLYRAGRYAGGEAAPQWFVHGVLG